MFRSCLIISLVALMATPALASKKRQESCAITAGIVSQAVDARIAGRAAEQAKADLEADDSGITGIYRATIPPLVDMVYGFEEDTLGEGVVKDYEEQCLNF